MTRTFALGAALALVMSPAFADDVTDALNSAISAYEEGDIGYAMDEIDYAKSLLSALKTQSLQKFLPEAPDGYTREIDDDSSNGMAMFGGGSGAEANYDGPDGSFNITILVDNPMVTAFGGMFSNAAMLGMKIERVGREKYLNDDGELTALIDGRILIQASGASTDVLLPVLETIDYRALADFGR